MAGDIGRLVDYDAYLGFLGAQAARYEKVLLVLGNHEFYGAEHQHGLEAARRLVREPSLAGRVVLLDRARWDDPGSDLTVLGCTNKGLDKFIEEIFPRNVLIVRQ